MTVEWYDLGQRLAADRLGRVVARLDHAPVPATPAPVAVRARRQGQHTVVTAAIPGGQAQTGRDLDALMMLAGLGVRITSDQPRTLVADEPGTLDRLTALAYAAHSDGLVGEAAAHIGWWADRGDFPGSSAVVRLPQACGYAWVTGATPAQEREAPVWRDWLQVSDGLDGMLSIMGALHQQPPLPRLALVADDDDYTWREAGRTHAEGWDWRRPDTLAQAAFGLRARCDAADWWQAALLDDPRYRRRAVHTGHVVHGTVRPGDLRGPVTPVVCDRLDARLRVGGDLTGWCPDAPDVRFHGMVRRSGVEHGRLVLGVTFTGRLGPAPDRRIILHAAAPNWQAGIHGRSRYRRLYSTRTSWLTTGRRPSPSRRDVPLDVLFASTDDD